MDKEIIQRRRVRWMSSLAVIFFIIIFAYLLYWFFVSQYYETTDDAYVDGNLIQVMPKISGQVVEILADETDLVNKGEPIIRLDKSDVDIALKNAESELALTVRQVSQLYVSVDQLKSDVIIQESNLEKTREDYQRRKGLVVTKVISSEDLQHAKLAVDSATASLALAKAKLLESVNMVSNSDLYHHPQILQAEVKLRNAYLSWQRTVVYAPETGYVAKRPVQVGQYVTPNSVLMIIVPLNQVWIDANFKESQLQHMRLGQPVELISDAYGSDIKYKGKVVGLNPGAGNVFDLLPPQNATGNWIKVVQRLPVRVEVDAQQLMKYPLRMGLSMTATVDTRHRDGDALAKLPQKKIVYQTLPYGDDPKAVDKLINQILESNAKNVSYPPSP
jgi:membrane fusion protein (multidrug efflux system)